MTAATGRGGRSGQTLRHRAELALLGELCTVVSARLNFFTSTKKPTGYATTADGRRKRVYDTLGNVDPSSPNDQITASPRAHKA
ncbi:MAG: hypothetical protein ACKVI4_11390 [Actinomycetales bacterium]|uniref:hypothetical protein n=1 Tax=uncultured Salinibacterium sp. TaxID=459274 RepID=UPI0030DBB636